MMKKLILFHLLSLFCIVSNNAQNLYDNTWAIGIGKSVTTIDWKKDGVPTSKNSDGYYMRLSISNANDAHGNFLFYTQGCAIIGKDYKALTNGKQINPGEQHNNTCGPNSTSGYVTRNAGVFLPRPNDTSLYYLFHIANSDNYAKGISFPPNKLYYTVIDASKGQNGVVTKKNILLVDDTLSFQGPYACRHANGIDWWIVVPEFDTHGYYSALLTKDSVKYVKHKVFSSYYGRELGDRAGQAVFTPDGTKYIRSDPFNGTYIYNFDRCSGELFNPVFIDTLGKYACAGVAISPNSRYLYLSNRNVLHQFDLQATDIAASKIKVADYDGTVSWIGTNYAFYKMALAPNGKIYMATTSTTDSLHVIHKPNEKGIACDFRQHSFGLPDYSYVTMPNFPNFRLGASTTPCAPLTENEDIKTPLSTFSISPNPTDAAMEIKVQQNLKSMTVSSAAGKIIQTMSMYKDQFEYLFNTSDLPNGIYFITGITTDGRQAAAQRFVVLH
jgi:Secretion system C-terminal sorting domain